VDAEGGRSLAEVEEEALSPDGTGASGSLGARAGDISGSDACMITLHRNVSSKVI